MCLNVYNSLISTPMAGSKKWFIYTTDQGSDFALLADESNTEAVNGSTQDYISGTSVLNALPRNIKPRRVVYKNAAGTRTISCIALTQTLYNGALANVATINDPIDAGTLTIARLEPERIRLLPRPDDTGLTDGDAT